MSPTRQEPLMTFEKMPAKQTEDDKRYAEERKRKRAKKPQAAPVPITGPCCLRCRNWYAPADPKEFGYCRTIGLTTQRKPGQIEKGVVVEMRQAWTDYRVDSEPLRTRAGMSCSAFRERGAA